MPWLVLAGLVEGFVTGSYPTAVVLPLGVALGALYWGLVFTLGRAPSSVSTISAAFGVLAIACGLALGRSAAEHQTSGDPLPAQKPQ